MRKGRSVGRMVSNHRVSPVLLPSRVHLGKMSIHTNAIGIPAIAIFLDSFIGTCCCFLQLYVILGIKEQGEAYIKRTENVRCLLEMKKIFFSVMIILLAAIGSCLLIKQVHINSCLGNLEQDAEEKEDFRSMTFTEKGFQSMLQVKNDTDYLLSDIVAVGMSTQDFTFSSARGIQGEALRHWQNRYLKKKSQPYRSLRSACQAIWEDVKCFPTYPEMPFENSWMFERSYGGKRGHEGTDIMVPENVAGVYPVFSMTDGTVESRGWLEKGGYRLGIRAPLGGYFYYAHLDRYAPETETGSEIKAGQLLGYIGDTGYGPEGTTGQFDTHLHLGIYIRTLHYSELSVNPYWILRYALTLSL